MNCDFFLTSMALCPCGCNLACVKNQSRKQFVETNAEHDMLDILCVCSDVVLNAMPVSNVVRNKNHG